MGNCAGVDWAADKHDVRACDELTPRSMAGTTTVVLRFSKAAKKSLRHKRGVKLAIAVASGRRTNR